MKLPSLDALFQALAEAGVRYIVVGGLAVNVHGLRRLTLDVDLVVELVPENIARTFAVLQDLGYRPIVPVTASQFADRATRETWIRDKGMTVLSFQSDRHRETPVDLFVSHPFEFSEEYERALVRPLKSVPVRFVALETLIRMKSEVGREQDRIDVENLKLRLGDGDIGS